ncbi:hypothetical protein CONLIGDRAFT_648792 [Coniochaeta ligniaria NRRL 30616]|uniref:Uncharacterized protein n=1 Tax=Coniochaeta ligniaria NRRL 30616 TaxID=1408157 RepID=A0A1J7IU75_9PEZI|nr:hypothetical protein CONLIGDRAFT_648792 [Coniochaeta ligniaria NRRL 30616]
MPIPEWLSPRIERATQEFEKLTRRTRSTEAASLTEPSGPELQAQLENDMNELCCQIQTLMRNYEFPDSNLMAELKKLESCCDRASALPSIGDWDDAVKDASVKVAEAQPNDGNSTKDDQWWESVANEVDEHIQMVTKCRTAMIMDLVKVIHLMKEWEKLQVRFCLAQPLRLAVLTRLIPMKTGLHFWGPHVDDSVKGVASLCQLVQKLNGNKGSE